MTETTLNLERIKECGWKGRRRAGRRGSVDTDDRLSEVIGVSKAETFQHPAGDFQISFDHSSSHFAALNLSGTVLVNTGFAMAERYPTSLRSVKSVRSLRRRSGTFSKNAHEETPESDAARAPSRSSTRATSSSIVSGKSRRMSTIVEDGNASSSRRVSTRKDAPLPPLPAPSPNPANHRFFGPDNSNHYGRRDDYPQVFSDVPLTPAQGSPDLERDGNSSRFSSHLPTPDFSRYNSIRSRLSIAGPPPTSFQQRSSRHSDSSTTLRTKTNDWRSDAGTLAHNRPPLIPASSGNWTQKWPKPRLNPKSLGGLVAAIEESQGLGVDKPDRWTTHKWVLLMSTLIAFGYSSVGLAYAMLTWFRGEKSCFPPAQVLIPQQAGNTQRSCTQRTAMFWFTSPLLRLSKFSHPWSGSAVLF